MGWSVGGDKLPAYVCQDLPKRRRGQDLDLVTKDSDVTRGRLQVGHVDLPDAVRSSSDYPVTADTSEADLGLRLDPRAYAEHIVVAGSC